MTTKDRYYYTIKRFPQASTFLFYSAKTEYECLGASQDYSPVVFKPTPCGAACSYAGKTPGQTWRQKSEIFGTNVLGQGNTPTS